VKPPKGVFFDRNELPERFRRMAFTQDEIDAIDTGGASLVV
jgi:small subunit ribosomal protein YMR-31